MQLFFPSQYDQKIEEGNVKGYKSISIILYFSNNRNPSRIKEMGKLYRVELSYT